jgi:hypothetical protein
LNQIILVVKVKKHGIYSVRHNHLGIRFRQNRNFLKHRRPKVQFSLVLVLMLIYRGVLTSAPEALVKEAKEEKFVLEITFLKL